MILVSKRAYLRGLKNVPETLSIFCFFRFLWGYDDNIIDIAKPILSLQGQLNFDKFGLLVTVSIKFDGFSNSIISINMNNFLDKNLGVVGCSFNSRKIKNKKHKFLSFLSSLLSSNP